MKQIIVIFFCVLLTACGSNVTDDCNFLNIDGAEKKVPSISDIKVVALETNDSVVVGNISKLLVRNDRIYLYDRNGGLFFVFTSEGKHIATINRRGAGPQEYIMPIDMDVDGNGNIYIADAGSRNIMVYDSNGSFIKRIEIGRMFTGIGVVDENNIWLANVSEGSSVDVKLAYYDVMKKELNVVSRSMVNDELNVPMVSSSPFFRSSEKLMFYDRFTPYCYTLDKNGNTCDSIKIVSQRIPRTEEVEEWVKSPQSIQTTDKITGLSALYLAGDKLYMSLVSQYPQSVLWSENHEPFVFDSFANKRTMNLNQTIFASYGKYLLSYMPAEDIMNKEIYSDEVRDVAKSLNSESNPVILMYRFE